jgi:hypothetical protein
MAHGKKHLLGDSDNHDQDTLANLNALISDADLMGSGAGLQSYTAYVGDDLKSIIEGISDSSISKPYVVNVHAGVYSIGNNSIAVPAYVTVKGIGSVILDYTGNTTSTALTMASGASVRSITVQNHLSSSYAIPITATGSYVLDDVVFINCTSCINVNHSTASVTIRGVTLLPFSSAMTNGVRIDGGDVTVDDLTVGGAQTLTNALWADSADAAVHFRHFLSVVNSNVTYGMRCSNSANIEGDTYDIHNATRGIWVESGGVVRCGSGAIENCTYGIYVEGSNSTLGGYGLVIKESATANVFAGANTLLYGMGRSNSDNFQIDPAADMLVSFLDTFEGDESLALSAEVHVGTPQRGRESCLGEGDSYVNGMLVYTYNGSVYADVTTSAKSPSASTFTFPNTSVNTAIYVGTSVPLAAGDYHKFFGIKMIMSTAQSGGTIVSEYYNGSSWVEFPTMTCESGGDYYRKGDLLFTVATGTYQIRFDPNITSDWTKNDDPTVGTNYFWVRFRITSTLTTAPVFEQFKVHANRTEINADGYVEFMGSARPYVGISVPWSTFQDAGGSVADQDLWKSSNCKTGFINNNFNTDGDSVGTVFSLPAWVDTSAPIKVSCVVVPSATGTLQMIAWLNSSVDGDTISTTDPSSTTGEISDTVSKSVTAGQQVTYDFELDISDKGIESASATPEAIWLNIETDSRPGNVYGMLFGVKLLKWRDGEHL